MSVRKYYLLAQPWPSHSTTRWMPVLVVLAMLLSMFSDFSRAEPGAAKWPTIYIEGLPFRCPGCRSYSGLSCEHQVRGAPEAIKCVDLPSRALELGINVNDAFPGDLLSAWWERGLLSGRGAERALQLLSETPGGRQAVIRSLALDRPADYQALSAILFAPGGSRELWNDLSHSLLARLSSTTAVLLGSIAGKLNTLSPSELLGAVAQEDHASASSLLASLAKGGKQAAAPWAADFEEISQRVTDCIRSPERLDGTRCSCDGITAEGCRFLRQISLDSILAVSDRMPDRAAWAIEELAALPRDVLETPRVRQRLIGIVETLRATGKLDSASDQAKSLVAAAAPVEENHFGRRLLSSVISETTAAHFFLAGTVAVSIVTGASWIGLRRRAARSRAHRARLASLMLAAPEVVELFEFFGVTPGASPREMRRAYRRRLQESHPDMKGGSLQAFLQVKESFAHLTTCIERLQHTAVPEGPRTNE